MKIDVDKLPDDSHSLKKILTQMQEKSEKDEQSIFMLKERLKILENTIYGKKSEKLTQEDRDQLQLFDEVELLEEGLTVEGIQTEAEPEQVAIQEYTRKKAGRKPIPENLPRKEIVHDLPAEEKSCSCCQKELSVIDKKITEELATIPQQIYVKKHIRYVYGACCCKESIEKELPAVKMAPMPPRLLPGSIVSPELLAFICVSKYCDGLPLYRQAGRALHLLLAMQPGKNFQTF